LKTNCGFKVYGEAVGLIWYHSYTYLGRIYWSGKYKRWNFAPAVGVVAFDYDAVLELGEFMNKLVIKDE
jgi:hypothetical protein